MAAKFSKEIVDRLRSCLFVLSALLRQGPRIAAAMLASARSTLLAQEDESPPPDFQQVIEFFRVRLRAAIDTLVETERDLYELNREHTDLRDEREETVNAVAQQMVRLRRLVEAQFEAPRFDQLGMTSANPREPVALLVQAETVVKIFSQPSVGKHLGTSALAMSFDPQDRAEELRVPTERLRQVVDGLNDVRRRIDEALVAKREALKVYDQNFVRTARIFEEYFLYVDEKDLAERVRPSSRRPGRTEVPPSDAEIRSGELDPEPEDEPEGDSDGDSGDSDGASDEEQEDDPFDHELFDEEGHAG